LASIISFSGIVTFKNAAMQSRKWPRNAARPYSRRNRLAVPAPVPFRGKPNEPAYVRYVAEEIASLRSQSVETIHQATSDNFFSLFTHAKRP
jgi:TatD DNase family protein